MTDHLVEAQNLAVGYGGAQIISGLDFSLTPRKITVIVGANACGKSTLLKTMARLLTPNGGVVTLDGASVHRMNSKKLAQVMGLLPQTPIAPEGITVSELVGRGRYPHKGAFARWTLEDDAAVAQAMQQTATLELAERAIENLSGGQRQRVWIAMALAQEPKILMLDEPTTYLDISHQVEILDMLTDLNHQRGTTILMVLHDLNLAARYADELVAMKHGKILAKGTPQQVLTVQNIETVFGLEALVIEDPSSGLPMMIPRGRHHRNG